MPYPWPLIFKWCEQPYYYDTASMGPYWRWVKNGAIHPTNGYAGGACLTFDESSGFTTAGTPPMAEDPNIAMYFPGDHGTEPFDGDDHHTLHGSQFYVGAYPAATTLIFSMHNIEQFCQCCVAIDPDGLIKVFRSLPVYDQLLWESPNPIGIGEHRFGWLSSVNRVNGWFNIYLDQTMLVFSPGHNTAQHDLVARMGFGFGGTEDMRHSHMYVFQGQPADGDIIVRGGFLANPMPNNAVGAYQQFTPNTGTMVSAISDNPPDDGTYIAAATAGLNYSIIPDAVATTRRIYGVQSQQRYLRPVESAAALRPTVVVDDEVFAPEGVGSGSTSIAVARRLFRVNPKTGLPFTRGRLNSGVEWGGRS